MQRLVLILVLALCPLLSGASAKNKIFIKLLSKQICSQRLNQCFPIAIGSKQYPSPTEPGPHYVLIHDKQGFDWINPLTGRYYEAHEHNLGPIWIGVYTDHRGWEYGIHQTPDNTRPLSYQYSHGCFRMLESDITLLSQSIYYFDEIYIHEAR